MGSSNIRIRTTRILTTTLGIAMAFGVSLGLASIPGSAYAQAPSLVYSASIVTESADSSTAHITGVIFGDGRNVNGTCSPGGTLKLNFEWSFTQSATNIQQINVGFVGGDTRCVASGVLGQSGSSALDLVCPAVAGRDRPQRRVPQCFQGRPALCIGGELCRRRSAEFLKPSANHDLPIA